MEQQGLNYLRFNQTSLRLRAAVNVLVNDGDHAGHRLRNFIHTSL